MITLEDLRFIDALERAGSWDVAPFVKSGELKRILTDWGLRRRGRARARAGATGHLGTGRPLRRVSQGPFPSQAAVAMTACGLPIGDPSASSPATTPPLL